MPSTHDHPACSPAEADVLAGRLPEGPPVGTLARTFASLAHRDFLLFWSGAFLSNIGNWMQSVALGWLVLEMTGSSMQLGLLNFAASAPVFFLSFVAGICADRMDKRRLILGTQYVSLVMALVLGAVVSSGAATIPLIVGIALVSGIAVSFSFPAWQALISEIVPRRDLLNAIALNAAQFHASRLVGPAIAGLLVAAVGTAVCFYLNALSFIPVIAALLLIRHRPVPSHAAASSGWEDFREGLRYTLHDPMAWRLVLGVGLLSVFGLTFTAVLMPKFARDILGGDARLFGFLMGASGLGALIGALGVAAAAGRVKRSLIIRWGLLAYALATYTFAFASHRSIALLSLAVQGCSSLAVISTMNTSLQSSVPHRLRGRVMAFFVWAFMGWMPLGSLLAGYLAERLGPPAAVALGGTVPGLLAAMLFIRIPTLVDAEPVGGAAEGA